jgi:hypothetical protein
VRASEEKESFEEMTQKMWKNHERRNLKENRVVWKTKEEENFTGLLTATPPSIMLNSLVTGGSAFVSCKVNCTGGKYVGAADVAPHTSFTGTLSSTSCLACLHNSRSNPQTYQDVSSLSSSSSSEEEDYI